MKGETKIVIFMKDHTREETFNETETIDMSDDMKMADRQTILQSNQNLKLHSLKSLP